MHQRGRSLNSTARCLLPRCGAAQRSNTHESKPPMLARRLSFYPSLPASLLSPDARMYAATKRSCDRQTRQKQNGKSSHTAITIPGVQRALLLLLLLLLLPLRRSPAHSPSWPPTPPLPRGTGGVGRAVMPHGRTGAPFARWTSPGGATAARSPLWCVQGNDPGQKRGRGEGEGGGDGDGRGRGKGGEHGRGQASDVAIMLWQQDRAAPVRHWPVVASQRLSATVRVLAGCC